MSVSLVQQQALLRAVSRRAWLSRLLLVLGLGVVLLATQHTGALDAERYRELLPTLWTLAGDAWPPAFERWEHWSKPLLDTLTMSVAGTVGGVLAEIVS
ncbi:phosphonate ABC transporter, permease protein PhnE, partial [Azotobacter beijerinckii]|nr:phosphonate ABC transporter, permease protein PhnE [Azotobacter beijerinckii]